MKINSVKSNLGFTRALTSQEKQRYKNETQRARQALDLGTTTATVFDFSFPTTQYDTGIGTSYSQDAQKMTEMLKTMCGINSIQLGPQGQISNYVRSPYSGTSFSLGSHLIDLTLLTQNEYGNILPVSELQNPYFHTVRQHTNVDYKHVLESDGRDKILEKAYLNFRNLSSTNPLKQEFENFKQNNSYWLERDAMFEAFSYVYDTSDISKWPDEIQYLFKDKNPNQDIINDIKNAVFSNTNINIVDYEEFIQFIADKQLKSAKEKFNRQGIDIYGDSQIGFSQKDFWAHRNVFDEKLEFGCDIGGGNYSCWSPAIDFNQLQTDAGVFLYNKFDLFFKRYDGARIDAAWQYIKPLICETKKLNGEDEIDASGNKLGVKHLPEIQIPNNGTYIIDNIILRAANNNNIPHNKILLELLGGNSWNSLDAVKGKGMNLIHITKYAKDDWGRVKYYETKTQNPSKDKYQNLKPGDYTIGAGTHDDECLLEQAENAQNRLQFLMNDLNLSYYDLNSKEKIAGAIAGELFTTKNQFLTINDIMGSQRRINTPNTKKGNWEYRVPRDYEAQYHTNLMRNKGFNYPDALSKALKAKHCDQDIINSMDYWAWLLRQNGPLTTQDADKCNPSTLIK